MEYRVLVADDEPLALKSVCLIIEQRCENYKIAATAENGQEALQKIREYVPDLVILKCRGYPEWSWLRLYERNFLRFVL